MHRRRRPAVVAPKANVDEEAAFIFDDIRKHEKRLTRDGGQGLWENLKGKLFLPVASLDDDDVLSSSAVLKVSF